MLFDYLLLKNKVEDYFTDLFSRVAGDIFSSRGPGLEGGGTNEEKMPRKPRVKTMREIIYFIFKEHEVFEAQSYLRQATIDPNSREIWPTRRIHPGQPKGVK